MARSRGRSSRTTFYATRTWTAWRWQLSAACSVRERTTLFGERGHHFVQSPEIRRQRGVMAVQALKHILPVGAHWPSDRLLVSSCGPAAVPDADCAQWWVRRGCTQRCVSLELSLLLEFICFARRHSSQRSALHVAASVRTRTPRTTRRSSARASSHRRHAHIVCLLAYIAENMLLTNNDACRCQGALSASEARRVDAQIATRLRPRRFLA